MIFQALPPPCALHDQTAQIAQVNISQSHPSLPCIKTPAC